MGTRMVISKFVTKNYEIDNFVGHADKMHFYVRYLSKYPEIYIVTDPP